MQFLFITGLRTCPGGKCKSSNSRKIFPTGTSNSYFLCLQEVKISDLEFKEAHSGLNRMCSFSLKHNLHVLVTGLNAGMFVFKNFHVMIGLFPLFCSFKKWVESVVLLSGVGVSRLHLCLLHLM